jgi:hypothetical protein
MFFSEDIRATCILRGDDGEKKCGAPEIAACDEPQRSEEAKAQATL